jgi:hypothetical protein
LRSFKFFDPTGTATGVGDFVERAPVPPSRYSAFVDPSGGSTDSFTLAISQRDGDCVIIARRPRGASSRRYVPKPYSGIATGSTRLDLITAQSIRSDDDDRNRTQRRIGLDAAGRLIAVKQWKLNRCIWSARVSQA